ncbi:Arachidonate 5-lipoxygenase [Oryzias melastigma]|nr:Arachidonate 5-lipoxygenase [Oryzias melastigma]
MNAEYQVTVYTQNVTFAGTKDDVYITLVGQRGSSKHMKMGRNKFFFHRGHESTFIVTCSADLGPLLQIHLEKRGVVTKDKWLPAKVEVRSPHGKLYTFPIYHWLTKKQNHFFREGAAVLDFQEKNPQMFKMRKKELEKRKNAYRWAVYKEGMPLCIKANGLMSLPPDDRYPFTRDLEFAYTGGAA